MGNDLVGRLFMLKYLDMWHTDLIANKNQGQTLNWNEDHLKGIIEMSRNM